MAKAIETLSIKLDLKGLVGGQSLIDKLKTSFKGLDQVIAGNTKPAIQKLRTEINTFAATGNRSISTIEAQVTALRGLRREADINSTEFKQLTADISKFERQLGKAQGRRPSGGGRALAATQIGGAAISGGIFGGPEGFVGALGGAALGGVPGAFAGAAIGAQVGMIRQSLGGVAETVAEINSMKIALAGVSESAEDYQKSFANVISISKQFLFPIDKAIGEFTRLKAAVVGAGFGTEETTDVFKGFAAAILATGGNAEKLSGALLAASQVFSKGKVQAEELRGQIGERLPGAFTTFAQSIGVSSRELDDMLRKGEVSTENFVEFTRTLFGRFEKTAETLGSAPEKAGQRLQLALSIATLEYGGFFQKVGAGFQDYLANLVNFAVNNKKNFIRIAADVAAFAQDIVANIAAAAKNISLPFILAFDIIKFELEALHRGFKNFFDLASGLGRLVLRTDGFDDVDLPPTGQPSRQERASAIRAQLDSLFGQFEPGSNLFGTSLGDLENLLATSGGGAQATAAKSLAEQQQETYNRILAQITKRNALNAEDDKFERERIKIRIQAAKDIEAIDKGVADNRKQELFDLIERGRIDALRKVDLEEQKALLEQMLELEVAPQPTKLQAFVNEGKKSLEDLQQVAINVSQGIGNAVGSALTNGISSLIEGTKNAKEVFADFLKSVGQMLVQEGARMIATYIAIGVARAFAGLASASSPTPPQTLPGGSVQTGLGLNINGVDQGINPAGFAANGGPVNAGRPYIVGERGPELFVPGQSGGVMRNEEMRRLMGRSPAGAGGGAAAMNFTFETTNIGGTEYVSREQLEAAMATTRRQAANDGARRGMSMTLDKMQNSPRTRSRIGIS